MQSCSERKMMIKWRLCLIFSLFNLVFVFSSSASHLCRPDQKDALLEFKSEFYVQDLYANGRTKSWRNNSECCSWDGISCDPKTGMVVDLYLSVIILNGPLRSNSSLFRLQHLQSLDLSGNNLSGTLPESISKLKHLMVLSLVGCNFFGNIPYSLGNISYLTHLHLFENDFTGELPDSIGSLSQLTELKLDHNELSGNLPLQLLNLSELTYIDLKSNKFQGKLPSNMSTLSKLETFDVSGNSFSGSVPSSLFMIPSLTELDLGRNHFRGHLEIGNMSSPSKLEDLSLRDNNFNGPIPGSISNLVGLRFLDLSLWDTRGGLVDLSLFSHLISLEGLHLSGNHLKISETLHLPSPIESLGLSSCNIAVFPKFLQNLTSLYDLDISANRIEGQVPEWLWSLPELWHVNISQNSFSGFEGSADVIQRSDKVMLDISSNIFRDLPLLPKSLFYFFGSKNGFSGEIPVEKCELVALDTLVLSNNNFSGSIPRCFQNFNASISVLHLQNNSLSGVFPDGLFNRRLRSLDVGRNRLSGVLPKSLINCTHLEFLNVEENGFSDTFPFWLRLLPNLQVLVLRSNQFHGPMSSLGDSLSFPKLRIFDISKNRFNGILPSDYFAKWSALSSSYLESQTVFYIEYYQKSVGLTNKGLEMELVGSGFTIYKTIDVSGNRLQGDIPESIGLLKELIVLNMSNNAFTGRIPSSLGNLTNLESLDLSQNRLSGKIPLELGKLTFLARMNFSYNMLEGPVPQGTRIQSQNSSAFAGNPGLCGAPLQETCGRKAKEKEDEEKEEEEDKTFSWIAAAIAYVPGVFCGLTIGHILSTYKHDWFVNIFHSFT